MSRRRRTNQETQKFNTRTSKTVVVGQNNIKIRQVWAAFSANFQIKLLPSYHSRKNARLVREELQKMLSVPHGLILTSDKSKNALKGYTKKDGWTQSRWVRDAIQGDLRNLSAKLIAAALLLEFREETLGNFMRITKNYRRRRINIWRPVQRGSGLEPNVYFWPPREGMVFLPGVNDKVKELVKRDIKTFPVSQLLPALNRYDKKASAEARSRGKESYSRFLTNKDLIGEIASYNFS